MMDHNELSAMLANGVGSGVYLLYGDEEYIKESLFKKLTDALKPDFMPEFNINIMSDPAADELLNALLTPPMMSDKKLIIAREFSLFDGDAGSSSKKSMDSISDALKKLGEGTSVVFTRHGKLNAQNRLKKLIADVGYEVQFSTFTETEAIKWIQKETLLRGIATDRDAADLLFFYVGPMMSDVAGELEKLMNYVSPLDRITSRDVRFVTSDNSEVRVFSFVDHLAMGESDTALEELDGLKKNGLEVGRILYLLARQYRSILSYCRMRAQGSSASDIKAALEIRNDYAFRNLEKQVKVNGERRSQLALDILLDCDEGIKTGRYRDDETAFEIAVTRIVSLRA